MNTKLTINGVEVEITLTKEQQRAIAEKIMPKKQGKPWRAERGEIYWIVNHHGTIVDFCEDGDDADNYRYLTGNYFKTREEAGKYREYQEALGRVRHKILELNQGWEPDWNNGGEAKYTVYYYVDEYCIETKWEHCYMIQIPWCRTREIVQTIIDTMRDDLDIIRNYQ